MKCYEKLLTQKNEYVFVCSTLNLKLKDDELLKLYVQEKVKEALDTKVLFNTDYNDKLISDFLLLVENDTYNAKFPEYNVKISSSDLIKIRDRAIKLNYLGWMLGNVYRNVQRGYLYNRYPIEKLMFNGVNISIFNEALTQVEHDYLSTEIHKESLFSVTSLMVNLFELTLKSTSRRVLMDKIAKEMQVRDLKCNLLERVNNADESLHLEKDVMHRIYKFLVDNQIIVSNHNDYKELLKLLIENRYVKPITLNALLYNQVFKDLCKDEWFKFLEILFIDLDYRNNVAHCNFGYNYYDVNLTAILYQLFHMVARKNIFKLS